MILGHRKLNGISGHEAGRQLLAALYEKAAGNPVPEILCTDRGKPYFADRSLAFSITHTKHHVFCALSDQPVGIDAEEMDRPVKLRLAEKILSPGEMERFRASTDPRMTLLKFWVLKESYVKLLGTGLQGYPNNTDFDPDDPRIQIIDGCLLAVLTKRDFDGQSVPNPIYKVDEL